MSEILIKGMEMPKDCEECQIATVKSYSTWCPLKKCHIKKGYSFRDCPLKELPKKHGRLIDADELREHTHMTFSDKTSSLFENLIELSPTVVESEE